MSEQINPIVSEKDMGTDGTPLGGSIANLTTESLLPSERFVFG